MDLDNELYLFMARKKGWDLASMMYQAIKLKFPDIKGLVVEPISDGDLVTITFDDTGDITRKDVEEFINQFKKECKK